MLSFIAERTSHYIMQEPLNLVKDGEPVGTIVIVNRAATPLRFAGEELQLCA